MQLKLEQILKEKKPADKKFCFLDSATVKLLGPLQTILWVYKIEK